MSRRNDCSRFLHETGGIADSVASIDWYARGAQDPMSPDGLFTGHVQHPACMVTDPVGYCATHPADQRDAFAEVLLFGLGGKRYF